MSDALLDDLIAAREPDDDRYLVYADLLQTRGDPRGELIALDIHARKTGALRDPRAGEIERVLFEQLRDELAAPTGLRVTFERGFVHEIIVASHLIPVIAKRGWLAHEALALVRSIGVYDTSSAQRDTQPIELLTTSPITRTLERIAIGSARHGLVEADELSELFAGVPRLRMLELRSRTGLDEARSLAVEHFDRLESLALWMPGNDATLERLLAAPWPKLAALAVTTYGPINREVPAFMRPLLDGTRHPGLDQLALMSCGFEASLLAALPGTPLGKRLKAIGLHWRQIEDATLEELRDELSNVELIWPRPVGVVATADDEYQMSRRLRLGMDRDRKALTHARRATELEPTNYYHWTELGYVHEALDRIDDKLAAMDRAIEITRTRWGAWAGRGSALRDLLRYDEAREAYEIALALEPTRVALHYGLGMVHECAGRLADAIACFERASEHSEIDSTRGWYLASVAQALIEHGQLDEAARHLVRARELGPQDLRVRRLSGYERVWSNAPDEALAIGMAIPVGDDGDADLFTHALRAAALRHLGRGDEALAAYQTMLDECDCDCPAWIGFAWLGQTLGGRDPFTVLADVHDPLVLADAMAAHCNRMRPTPVVHDTVDRCNDRINVAVTALAAAIVTGREAEARSRAAALAAFLSGPATLKRVFWWIELAEMLRSAATRPGGELLISTYRLATGRPAI